MIKLRYICPGGIKMKLNDAYKIFNEIEESISKLKDRYGNFPDEFDFDYEDLDQRFKHNAALSVVDGLEDVFNLLKWVEAPIIAEGRLTKNQNDRYEVQGHELSSGHRLDYFDENHDEWVFSRIEHNGKDYYIYHKGKEENIENTLVRIRKKIY